MQRAERRMQNAGGKFVATLACAFVLLLHSSVALADGGTLRLSQRCGPLQVSVFTSPAMPHVGLIDISTLVQDAATGRILDDVPVVVRLQSIELRGLTLEQESTAGAATNKLFRAAAINVPEAGKWRAEILVGVESHSASASDRNFPTLSFDFDVAAPSPQWLSLAAWVGWPVGVIAVFLIHQILVARSFRIHTLRLPSSIRQNYVDTI
jgi:hypothetical protein